MSHSPTPRTIKIYDTDATFAVCVADEFGERLSVSVPTGRLAGYPEARRDCLDKAIRKVRAHVEAMTKVYVGADVVGVDALDEADPETLANTW
jgi:hypothetical protein